MVLYEALAISQPNEKPFNVDARLPKISKKSCPFMVKMVKSVRHGAMETTLTVSLDDVFFSLSLLTAMRGGSFCQLPKMSQGMSRGL